MDTDSSEPLDRTSPAAGGALSRQVFRRIRQWIREGKLKEGDVLPSERELAKTFDTSRVPVREAMKVLEFMGIAERVHGKGVFLRKMRMENIVSNLDFMLMTSQQNLLDLFEARLGIEVLAARLAATRRTGQDLERIGMTLKILGERMEAGASTLDASLDFHAAVIAASRNSVLIEMNFYLSDRLRMARERFREFKSPYDHGIAEHEGIFRAIEAMDADAAAERTRSHLTRPIDTLRQAIASKAGMENFQGEPLSG